MKKLVVSALVLCSAVIGYSLLGSNANSSGEINSDSSMNADLLVGSWEMYEEHEEDGTTLIYKGTTTYHQDKTESSRVTVYLSNAQHGVSGSAKMKSSATWEVKGDNIIEKNTSFDFSDYSGSEAVHGLFDQMKESSEKEIRNGTSKIEIRELTNYKLVVFSEYTGERTLKRISK